MNQSPLLLLNRISHLHQVTHTPQLEHKCLTEPGASRIGLIPQHNPALVRYVDTPTHSSKHTDEKEEREKTKWREENCRDTLEDCDR